MNWNATKQRDFAPQIGGRATLQAAPRLRRAGLAHAFLLTAATPLAVIAAVAVISTYGFHPSDLLFLAISHLVGATAPTVALHRHFAHRSFASGPVTRAALAILAMTAAQGPLIYWVSNHRHHHRYSDSVDDPHSPLTHGRKRLSGFFHAHIGWMFGSAYPNPHRYARDLLAERMIVVLNRLYPLWILLGLVVPAFAGLLLAHGTEGSIRGLVWGGLVRLVTVHHATFSINSLGHLLGSQRFATGDGSRNMPWLAIPTLGEAWHNNHHAAPSSARQGLGKFEIDIAFVVIRLMQILGLAWNVRVARLRDSRVCPRNEPSLERRALNGRQDAPADTHSGND